VTVIDFYRNISDGVRPSIPENETLHYISQVAPSSRSLIFDTKDLF
jgi:hypothetical protein